MSSTRQTTYAIHEVFTQRFSPRSFTGEPIAQETLLSFMEAARWTPSAHNSQPWRFIYSLNDQSAHWHAMLEPLLPQNKLWAKNASALVVFAAQTRWIPPDMDQEVPLPYTDFDVGAASMAFALQATFSGWVTHAIAGFDKDAMRLALNIPELYKPVLVMAVGHQNLDASSLPEDLRLREAMTQRHALKDLVYQNKFEA